MLGDLGLALGVLDQCSLRADRDRRRLVGASGDGAAGLEPNLRLARRCAAHACVDASGIRAQSGVRLGARLPALLGSVGAAIVLFFLFVRQESKARSPLVDLALLKGLRFLPERWRARFPTPCFTGCSSSLFSRLCAAMRTAPSPPGSNSRSFRSASKSSPRLPASSRIGWGRVSSASRGWRYVLSHSSRSRRS